MRARYRSVGVVVGVSVLVAACGGAVSPTDPAAGPATPTPGPPATAAPSPTPERTAVVTPTPLPSVEEIGATPIRVRGFVDWVVVVDGVPWVSTDGGLMPLDPATGAPGDVVPVEGTTCTALDVGYDAVWAATCENHSLTRVDPVARTSGPPLELPTTGDVAEEGSVAAGEGGVWVVTTEPSLVKVNRAGTKVLDTWPLPAGAAAVRAGLGWLWVTVPDSDLLLRIDPQDPDKRMEIKVGDGPRFLAVGEGAAWTMDAGSGTVTKVGPDGSLLATMKVADLPIRGGDIAVGGGYVWARTWDSLVVPIDAATGAVVRLGPASGSGSVAADDSAAWITAHDVYTIWRLPLPMAQP